ncbi:MAG: P1 family peptidase [Candidatus Eremiobacteraeota bacterium]|nr:P1 family peptidase [Candidatus Eremiobacteraeota bacterium]MBC5803219.1 P1 family peptidase [Candidatus Eremiobacteraeota bacterium]MBC5823015.1 P1 family peptidase [Candidatus Eremiobacteraeota bacterium]
MALRSEVGAAPNGGIVVGTLPAGRFDAITDVAGVRVGQVTKIEGAPGPLIPGKGPVRTGVTVVLPNDDPWSKRVAAATFDLNGNGEMTGAHWVDESGFLEVPIALTNTLDVPRVDDGVITWLIAHHPEIGVRADVPLPVVAECDDQGINDIQGRHVLPSDAVAALSAARPGPFARGDVGAGTGMRAFGFKGGIGTASRVVPRDAGGYTVGVLVNANTGSREELRIDGVPIGRIFAHELLPTVSKAAADARSAARVAAAPRQHGRAADGSIIVTIATDAPLDHRQLRELAKRATLGLARTGVTSHVSSGDLLIAFSTTHLYPRDPAAPLASALVNSDDVMDALFAATAEATEAAVVDALLSARTLSGARGLTYYALPAARVERLIDATRKVWRTPP